MKLTEKKVIQVIENTFERLKTQHIIPLQERQNTIKQIFKNKLGEEKFVRNYHSIEIVLDEIKEQPSLFIEADGKELAWANYKQNRIHVNMKSLLNFLQYASVTEIESKYKKETKFIRRNVSNKTELVKWLLAHEYAHTLRYEKVNHTNDFFQKVEYLFQSVK